MSEYDTSATSDRRFPRVITMKEILSLPVLPFEKGIGTAIFLSQERDDARHFRQGICWQTVDHDPYKWNQTNFDETHYCLKGKIRLKVKDAEGRVITLEAAQGEQPSPTTTTATPPAAWWNGPIPPVHWLPNCAAWAPTNPPTCTVARPTITPPWALPTRGAAASALLTS